MTLTPVVLIKGDDPILVAQARWRRSTTSSATTIPRSIVEDMSGDDDAPAAVAESAATPAFLADRRVIVIARDRPLHRQRRRAADRLPSRAAFRHRP